jgi:hypothetical protein
MRPHTAFLVPMPGLIVRDPTSKLIMLETGEVKPLRGKEGRYWLRRLKDGSVTIKNMPKPKVTRRKKPEIKED